MSDDVRRRPLTPGRAVVLTVVVAGLATVGVLTRPVDSPLAVWWPAAGVAVIALLTTHRRDWPWVCLLIWSATAGGNVLAGREAFPAGLFGIANTVEALVTAVVMLRLSDGRVALRTVDDVGRLLASAICGAAAGSLVVLGLTELVLDGNGLLGVRTFLVTHPTGVLLVAPVVLVMSRPRPGRRWLELAVQGVALMAALGVVFGQDQSLPLSFLPTPVLLWAALRFGPGVTTAQTLAAGVYGTLATALGWGPFAAAAAASDATLTILLVQSWVVVTTVVMLVLSLTVERYRVQAETVRRSEELLRRTFDEAMLGMLWLRAPDGEPIEQACVVRTNDLGAQMLGVVPGDLVGAPWLDLLHPGDRSLARAGLAQTTGDHADGWQCELRVTVDGSERWLAVTMSPLGAGDEGGLGISVQMDDVTDRRDAQNQLQELALQDPLTSLANRTLLMQRLRYWLHAGGEDAGRVVLLFCDLDDFKNVNDSSGHAVGDAVLVQVAERLRRAIRPQDLVARLGGDEFVFLLPCRDQDAQALGEGVARRLLDEIARPMQLTGSTYRLAASMGLTVSRDGSTPESLLREADTAMYEAKREGKNRFASYTDAHHAKVTRRLRLGTELHTALERHEFRLHVQPVLDLATGEIVAGEMLVRWQHPEQGLLLPGSWLDVAESTDVIHGLGTWVLQEACRVGAHWCEVLGDRAPTVHANVSARQLGRGLLVPDVLGALEAAGLPGSQLVIELTETQLDRAESAVLADVDQLRSAGVRLAADDFGTGYSSLTRLTDLPVDVLKIDRTFVGRMVDDRRASAVVGALLAMGDLLDIEVVAEGVETTVQEQALRDLGCRKAQGFLWSRAVEPSEFLAQVTARRSVTT